MKTLLEGRQQQPKIWIPKLNEKRKTESQWSTENPFSASWPIEVGGFEAILHGSQDRYNVFSACEPKYTPFLISCFCHEFGDRDEKTNTVNVNINFVIAYQARE